MIEFIRNLRLDQISFWLGFLAGSLFWFLIASFRPLIVKLGQRMKTQAQAARGELTLAAEIRLGNDTMNLAQGWHLAASLFSLDEILVSPRFLAPPVPYEAEDSTTHTTDITDWAIPYMPDWPELASFYGVPSFTLAEALQGGANLAIIGQPGTGKTVALAHLATQIIRKRSEAGNLSNLIPLLVHVAELALPTSTPEDPSATLLEAISRNASTLTAARLPKLLAALFDQKRVILLLDGLDELSPAQLDEAVQFLKILLARYPGLRAVVTASPEFLDGLCALDFIPIPIAGWDQTQRHAFIQHWGEMWARFVLPVDKTPDEKAKLLLFNGWLVNDIEYLTPLELTLKCWAAFSGDILGPKSHQAAEAFVRRMMHDQPQKNLLALQQLAAQMTLAMRPVVDRRDAEAWLAGSKALPDAEVAATPAASPELAVPERSIQKDRIKAPGALPSLIESGLVLTRAGERVSIAHPALAGYLAGLSLAQSQEGANLLSQPYWSGKSQALHQLALVDGQSSFIEWMLEEESKDPLLRGLFTAARLLRNAPGDLPWVSAVLRQLAACLQKEKLPLSIKSRALTSMILSGGSGIAVLFRQLLASQDEELRQLAVLGCGAVRETKAITEIVSLLRDKSPNVMRAAILALVAIGNKNSLEAVAYALLHGDDSVRQAAAEGLANHPEEGFPTLEEASSLPEPAVRRASVFGLKRVKQPWALDILEKLRADNSQWVVQDAANQALSMLSLPDPHIPKPLPELTRTPWLIAYAAERGIGVAPGKPAYELLYRALKEGKEEYRLAAIHYLGLKGDENSVLPLYQTYYTSIGELKEASFNALWHLNAAGIPLPPPAQYGLK